MQFYGSWNMIWGEILDYNILTTGVYAEYIFLPMVKDMQFLVNV